MTPSALQSLYECRHESQEKWTLWAVAMSKAWPEMYRGLSALTRFSFGELARQLTILIDCLEHERSENLHFVLDDSACEVWAATLKRALQVVASPPPAPTDAKPTLWLRMLGDSPDWGEDCVGQDADDIDTYNYNTDLDADEKCWALPLYRWPTPPPAIEVSPKLGEAMEAYGAPKHCPISHQQCDRLCIDFCNRYEEAMVVVRELVACDDARGGETIAQWDKAWAAARALLASPIAPAVEQENGK